MAEPEELPHLDALVRNRFGRATRAGLPGGCPAAMFELDDVDGPARDKVVERESGWRGLLEGPTRRAVKLGHLRTDLDVGFALRIVDGEWSPLSPAGFPPIPKDSG